MKLGVHSKLDAIVAAIRHGRVRTEEVSLPADSTVDELETASNGEEGR
jgi:hypothetical protein